MVKTTFLLCICLGFSAGTIAAYASESSEDLDVEALPFRQQADRIRSNIAESERYAELSPENRSKVLHLLTRMEGLLDAAGGIDAMSIQSKVDLFNDQEKINTILTGARADSRMVCRREVATGSHRRQQNCMTVAERERRRQLDHKYMQDQARATPCLSVGPNCVSP